MINIAQIGVGYWGPNVLRNLASITEVNLAAVCDMDITKAQYHRDLFCPGAKAVNNCEAIINDTTIDAVVIATPIRSHFELGMQALRANKHVLVEKPLAATVAECEALVEEAEKRNLVLMVGHVFEFNNAVCTIKDYINSGDLGNLLYVYSQRVNLGRIQNDINALWSFAPHDISIMNYWLGADPVSVSARGFSFLTDSIEDVVFLIVDYPGGIKAHLHLGWLDPRKVRQMTLVASKKMLVYDDVSMDAKIQIYDKGVSDLDEYMKTPESFGEFQFRIRNGDLTIPSLKFGEPLNAELRHFVECIQESKRPKTDGHNGLRVVKVLEAAEKSMQQGGLPVDLRD